jgi:hypothetical protein
MLLYGVMWHNTADQGTGVYYYVIKYLREGLLCRDLRLKMRALWDVAPCISE